MAKQEKQFIKFHVEVEKKEGTVLFVASTANADRMHDVINQMGWELERFKKNPVILWAHDSDSLPVGKAVNVYVDGTLKIEVQFASDEYEFARTVEKLVKNGYLNAVSVGFIPLEDPEPNDHGGYDFKRNELLEVSIVPVPANAEALVQMGLKDIDVKKAIKDQIIVPDFDVEEIAKHKSYYEKNRPVLKEYRKMLKTLRGMAELDPIDDEIKSIKQIFSFIELALKNQSKSDDKVETQPEKKELETPKIVIKVSENSELFKSVNK